MCDFRSPSTHNKNVLGKEIPMRILMIANNMSRDRYFLIRNWIKAVFDGDITQEERKSDRLWTVRPLLIRVL